MEAPMAMAAPCMKSRRVMRESMPSSLSVQPISEGYLENVCLNPVSPRVVSHCDRKMVITEKRKMRVAMAFISGVAPRRRRDPVSYTHLDVYKRQVRGRGLRGRSIGYWRSRWRLRLR